jgi:hypothetical protein
VFWTHFERILNAFWTRFERKMKQSPFSSIFIQFNFLFKNNVYDLLDIVFLKGSFNSA